MIFKKSLRVNEFIIHYTVNHHNIINTVEPRYNEILGTMKIILLYQVSHYIRVKKNTKKYKKLGPANLPCYIRGFLLYPTFL